MTVDHTNHHTHEWVVFSTALAEGWLMLQCVECLARATVDDPTEEEWAEAFHAPSRPYQWTDETRVHLRKEPPCPLYVVRTEKNAPICNCPSRQEPKVYERFPAEILVPGEKLTQEEKNELEELADLVSKSDLCSSEFPFFLKSYQDATGYEPAGAARQIASLIETIDGMSLHLSPSVVAKVLRLYVAGQNNNPH